MTSATDTDIQQLKDLIVAGNAATQKQIADLAIGTQKQISDLAISTQGQIADLREEMRLGFADIKGEFKEVRAEIKETSNRLTAVETSIKGLDARLWGFGGIILSAVLAALLTIFGRFLFTGNPIA